MSQTILGQPFYHRREHGVKMWRQSERFQFGDENVKWLLPYEYTETEIQEEGEFPIPNI